MDMYWFGCGTCTKLNKFYFFFCVLVRMFHFKKYFSATEWMPIAEISAT